MSTPKRAGQKQGYGEQGMVEPVQGGAQGLEYIGEHWRQGLECCGCGKRWKKGRGAGVE